jgi:hypothetical protein
MDIGQFPPTTSRTPRRRINAVFRLCVRATAVCEMFPLVGLLPSTASADVSGPSLFGRFVGTMGPSDFPAAYMSDVYAFGLSPTGPPDQRSWALTGSPGSRAKSFHACTGSSTPRGPSTARAIAPSPMLPSAPINNVGAPIGLISELNGRPACTPVNASPAALRRPTYETRGRCGALTLHRVTLSFTTPCRF